MTRSENPTDIEREAELALTTELDLRWSEHLKDPGSAIPWDEVRRKLEGNE